MKLRPLGDRVLVKKDPISDKTDGGIIVSGEQNEKLLRTGKIVALGKIAGDEYEVHDRVLFNKYAGNPMDDDCVMLRKEEVIAVFLR